ncbi:MAG TPA: GNAT family N-acetyltransferase [Burkholderiales bacterium]|nr:GNAT family N-acetyltransferase [Burkholderiales bacterium]
MSDCSIRLATRANAEDINGIQNHYVVHSTATFLTDPLTLEQRLSWLENRSQAHPVIVAQADDSIIGWGSLEVFRSRPAYRHTAEFSIYVHQEWHRRGIGRAILADLVTRARALGHHALVGGCCSESTAVIALLEASGFSRVAHFREVGRKFDRWLDVVFLQRLL